MSSYELVIAKAKAFRGETYAGLLREIADFAEEAPRRTVLGVNIESYPDDENDETLTAYVMYEG